jgi:hypothetical protein
MFRKLSVSRPACSANSQHIYTVYMLWICIAYICVCVYICVCLYIHTHTHTHYMEQSPSWEANQFAGSQEIPHILWNLKVHYCIHKCPGPAQSSPYPHILLPEDQSCIYMYIGNKYSERLEHLKYWVTSLINRNQNFYLPMMF